MDSIEILISPVLRLTEAEQNVLMHAESSRIEWKMIDCTEIYIYIYSFGRDFFPRVHTGHSKSRSRAALSSRRSRKHIDLWDERRETVTYLKWLHIWIVDCGAAVLRSTGFSPFRGTFLTSTVWCKSDVWDNIVQYAMTIWLARINCCTVFYIVGPAVQEYYGFFYYLFDMTFNFPLRSTTK